MTVCVLGLGQIGLPLALLIAKNRRVIGVDIDESRVEALNDGTTPVDEPDVDALHEEVAHRFVARTSVPSSGSVSADASDAASGQRADVDSYIIVTPTPLSDETGVADLRYVREATETVAGELAADDLVVTMSTVPPGTAERLVIPTLQNSELGADDFRFAHCPERAIPGRTIHEMVHNDRIVGAKDSASARAARDLFDFVDGDIYTTDPKTAEFVKLIENTYRDINIAAANQFAKLADGNDIDCRKAIQLANKHPRVDILSPGPGVGGHCLPIDPQFLMQGATDARLITTARDINESMAGYSLNLVRRLVPDATATRISVLGVAYKGNVADTRKTPALQFYQLAHNEGYDIRLHDPHVERFVHDLESFESAISGSDCLVILADHDEYLDLDVERIGSMMRTRNLVDTRGMVRPDRWRDGGFTVQILGDGTRESLDTEAKQVSTPTE
jgi:UDP-N-acetyl-D-mannosaminuronic acid dehydrogenase